jgi:hypothetical protein
MLMDGNLLPYSETKEVFSLLPLNYICSNLILVLLRFANKLKEQLWQVTWFRDPYCILGEYLNKKKKKEEYTYRFSDGRYYCFQFERAWLLTHTPRFTELKSLFVAICEGMFSQALILGMGRCTLNCTFLVGNTE